MIGCVHCSAVRCNAVRLTYEWSACHECFAITFVAWWRQAATHMRSTRQRTCTETPSAKTHARPPTCTHLHPLAHTYPHPHPHTQTRARTPHTYTHHTPHTTHTPQPGAPHRAAPHTHTRRRRTAQAVVSFVEAGGLGVGCRPATDAVQVGDIVVRRLCVGVSVQFQKQGE